MERIESGVITLNMSPKLQRTSSGVGLVCLRYLGGRCYIGQYETYLKIKKQIRGNLSPDMLDIEGPQSYTLPSADSKNDQLLMFYLPFYLKVFHSAVLHEPGV